MKQSMAAPEEITEEILLKLPPYSLIRFKRLSKSWYSRISDPRFIQRHLHEYSYHRPHLILSQGSNRRTSYLVFDTDSERANSFKSPFINFNQIVCSYDGLLCLASPPSKSLMLLNPLTGDRLFLPFHHYHDELSYGLGYDSTSNDYKLIQCGKYYDFNMDFFSHKLKRVCNVFSLKTNSCRATQNYNYDISPRSKGEFVNGYLHWIHSSRGAIVAFSLAEQKFMKLSPPGDVRLIERVGTLQDCLCLVNLEFGRAADCSVWLMKEYGNGATWTIFATVTPSISSKYVSLPFCFMKEIWINSDWKSKLVLHDFKEQNDRIVEICCHELSDWHINCGYVESLVSASPISH